MRIVLDTNVLVSGLISPHGPPGRLLAEVKRGNVALVTSREQIRELQNALGQDRLSRRIQPEEAEDFVRHLEAIAEVATDLPQVDASPDPDDNRILATAVAGRADLIVSGDKRHVLALDAIEGIPIVTASDAVARLGAAR